MSKLKSLAIKCRLQKLILCLAFTLVIAIRLPFLSNILVGEEGLFAMIATSSESLTPSMPKALFLSRIDNKVEFINPMHPIAPYYLMRGFSFFGNVRDSDSIQFKTLVARVPFLVLFLIAALIGIGVCMRALRNRGKSIFLPILFLLSFLCTPLMVGGSIQPQLDGSIGIFTVSLVFMTFFLGVANPYWLVVSGFISTMGKNEWSLTFLVALLLGYIFLRIWSASVRPKFYLAILGVILGSAFQYVLSPEDFISGIQLIANHSTQSSGWVSVFRSRVYFIYPTIFALLAVSIPLFMGGFGRKVIEWEFGIYCLILMLWGVLIFAGYFKSNWVGDGFPRYFAPAGIAIAFSTAVLAGAFTSSIFKFVLTALIVVNTFSGFALRSRFSERVSITSIPGINLVGREEQLRSFCNTQPVYEDVYLRGAESAYYCSKHNIINRDIGIDAAISLMKKYPNKQLIED